MNMDIIRYLAALRKITAIFDFPNYLRKQDQDGHWLVEYNYACKTWGDFEIKQQPNKWVTYRVGRVQNSSKRLIID